MKNKSDVRQHITLLESKTRQKILMKTIKKNPCEIMKSGHCRIFFHCGGSNALDKQWIFLLVKMEKNQQKAG